MKRTAMFLFALAILTASGCATETSTEVIIPHETAASTAIPAETPQQSLSGQPFPFLDNTFVLRRILKNETKDGKSAYDIQFLMANEELPILLTFSMSGSSTSTVQIDLRLLAQDGSTTKSNNIRFVRTDEFAGYTYEATFSFELNEDQALPNQAELYEVDGGSKQVVDLSNAIVEEGSLPATSASAPSDSRKESAARYDYVNGEAVLTETMEYDQSGRVVSGVTYLADGTESGDYQIEYDGDQVLSRTNYVGNAVVSREAYEYDSLKNCTSFVKTDEATGSKLAWKTSVFDQNGRLLSCSTKGENDDSETKENYQYDQNGQLTKYNMTVKSYFQEFEYYYDEDGLLIAKVETDPFDADVETYSYTDGKLTQMLLSYKNNDPYIAAIYSYYEDGTLASEAVYNLMGDEASLYLLKIYSLDGELIVKNRYDFEGNFLSTWGLEFEYDSLGRLVQSNEVQNDVIVSKTCYTYTF